MGLGTTQISILLIFANPRNTEFLRLAGEDKAILDSLRRSQFGSRFQVIRCHAATIHDIRRTLLENEIDIVHISSHGIETGLILEDDAGDEYVVPPQALATLLDAHNPPLECVLLNACYSADHGEAIAATVPYVILVEGPASDDAAVEFSRGFYDALGAGKDIPSCYAEGCRTVALTHPQTGFVSKLLERPTHSRTETTKELELTSSTLPDFVHQLNSCLETTKAGKIVQYEMDHKELVVTIATRSQYHIVRVALSELEEQSTMSLIDQILPTVSIMG